MESILHRLQTIEARQLLVMIAVCSGIDLLVTMVLLSSGLAEEFNPLLRTLYYFHPIYFVCMKWLLTGTAIWLYNLWLHEKSVRFALVLSTVSYLLLNLYEVGGLLAKVL